MNNTNPSRKIDRRDIIFGALISFLVTVCHMGIMYGFHFSIKAPFMPFDLFNLFQNIQLNGWVRFSLQLLVILPFVLFHTLLGTILWIGLLRYPFLSSRKGRWTITLAYWVIMLTTSIAADSLENGLFGSIPGAIFLFLNAFFWSSLMVIAYRRVQVPATDSFSPGRRRFLIGLGSATVVVSVLTGWLGIVQTRVRDGYALLEQKAIDRLPETMRVKIFPLHPDFQFPEMRYERYQPHKHPFGVCFSGGGFRAFTAAIGQMRGLYALGMLDDIGCISAISGSSLFTGLFTYAPHDIDTQTLLGQVRLPHQITVENLAQINTDSMASVVANMTNANFIHKFRQLSIDANFSDIVETNRTYSRIIGDLVFQPFGLANFDQFFTLDETSWADVVSRNPQLDGYPVYLTRPGQPYLVVPNSHLYPPGANQIARHFEYTPLYSGSAQYFPGIGPDGTDVGGGYVESIALDSHAPTTLPDAENIVTLPTPYPLFSLTDLFGSSTSVFSFIMNFLSAPEWFPVFNYWSVAKAGKEPHSLQTFSDGGSLDNIGIVSLLRRQYPVILAFVNGVQVLGEENESTIEGIDSQISELFGLIPAGTERLNRQIHIFPTDKFQALADGLKSSLAQGKGAFFIDSYPIVQPNPFDLPPYPNDGEVMVMWFYTSLNQNWYDQLSDEVKALFQKDDPTNNLSNFPNYATFNQNTNETGIPEIFYLQPEQINLMAHMWQYLVQHEAGAQLQTLRARFSIT